MIIKTRLAQQDGYMFIDDVKNPIVYPVVFSRNRKLSGDCMFLDPEKPSLDGEYINVDEDKIIRLASKYDNDENSPYPHAWKIEFNQNGNDVVFWTSETFYLMNENGKTVDTFAIINR